LRVSLGRPAFYTYYWKEQGAGRRGGPGYPEKGLSIATHSQGHEMRDFFHVNSMLQQGTKSKAFEQGLTQKVMENGIIALSDSYKTFNRHSVSYSAPWSQTATTSLPSASLATQTCALPALTLTC